MDGNENTEPPRSVADYIGGLKGDGIGELMRLADELRALRESSGWRVLGELLAIEHSRLDRLAVGRQRQLSDSLDALVKNSVVSAHEAGMVAGLHTARRIIDTVLETAEVVRGEIEGED